MRTVGQVGGVAGGIGVFLVILGLVGKKPAGDSPK
jgi:hypothetical protein